MSAAAAALVAAPLVAIGSTAGAAETDTVLGLDFDDESTGDWTRSGEPTLGYVAAGDGAALEVANRTTDYDGISSPEVAYEAGESYTFTMRAKLPDGTDGEAGIRFVVATDYTWVGNTTISDDEWTTVTGTYTPTADVTRSIYLGTGDLSGTEAGTPYTYLVDDIEVTRAGEAGEAEVVLSSDFETAVAPWVGRGDATVVRTTDDAHAGDASMLVSGRTADWHGAATPIGSLLTAGSTYDISAWVRLAPGEEATTVKATVAETPEAYTQAAPAVDVTDEEWVELTGTYTRGAAVTGGDLYFEAAGPDTSFLVDDVVITGQASDGWEPDLEGFVPGGAVNPTTTPVGAARGTGNVAALTFDDGPNGADTAALLDFLAEKEIEATFCVIGEQITAPGGADMLKRIVSEGHTLCNHSSGWADMAGYTKAQVEADLKANLKIIRDALGDPNAQVPYFRAPNGSWGQTIPVAAALGMQPLAVSNTIDDWATQDEDTLTENLRAAMVPGRIVLVHDGGGDRAASVAATETVVSERLAEGWTFTLPQGGVGGEDSGVNLSFDFEDGTLQGWTPRSTAEGTPTVGVVEGGHESEHAAQVSERLHQGQGLQYDVTGLLAAGQTYEFEAWIRFEGTPGDATLSVRTEAGGTSNYGNLASLTGMSNEWTRVASTFTIPAYETAAEIYFETAWDSGNAGNTSTFLLDDISITSPGPITIEDITPLKDTVPFPMGIAIDSRETLGAPGELTQRHFNQYSAENHMKPYAWYDDERNFRVDPQATAIMDAAVANDARVYGHVLVWHSQNAGQTAANAETGEPANPGWMFLDDDGKQLTSSAADQQILKDRLRTHIFAIAENLHDTYGPFGSDSNPLVAWDVVNEVVSDGAENPDGLRRSAWFNILGEQFIDLAFIYADEAFNEEYAAEGTDRPVTLFINDYNTEHVDKQDRYFALVERLLERGVPIDGVGHQFHVSMSLPVAQLEAAIERFEALDVVQAVTELDVATGTPVTDAKLIDQGYYYKEAFDIFRSHADTLYSVTVWGLNDGRSWVNANGAPLLFNDSLQAKPAYYGAADQELPAPIRTALVFGGELALDENATSAVEWGQLRENTIGEVGGFQLRWAPDTLTVLAEVTDPAATGLQVQVGDATYAFNRDGTGDVEGVVSDVDGGWRAVLHVPLTDAAAGGILSFDLRVVAGDQVTGWATGGPTGAGTLTLAEDLSYVEVVETSTAPTVDGDVDEAWAGAVSVMTSKQVSGTGTAVAEARTLWKDGKLYVLMEVADADIDVTGTDPWIQDSVEVYVDAGNYKNGAYRAQDMQIRVNADNLVSFGAGDVAAQQARVETATSRTDDGYVVEMSVDLLEESGVGTFHGLDFQVNDASGGSRLGITNWADPTGQGYQSNAHWGVGQLVSSEPAPGPATAVPTAPRLSHDNWDGDGTFTLLSSMWWGQNAHTLTLLENGKEIASQRVVDATPGAQIVPFEVSDRKNGTYTYEVVATNQHGSTTSQPLVLRIANANPGAPVVLHDNWDGNGTYTVTMHMWWGTNADTYKLYENGKLVDTQTLTPNGRNAQHAGTRLTGRAKGIYKYTAELSNSAGTTRSVLSLPVIVWR